MFGFGKQHALPLTPSSHRDTAVDMRGRLNGRFSANHDFDLQENPTKLTNRPMIPIAANPTRPSSHTRPLLALHRLLPSKLLRTGSERMVSNDSHHCIVVRLTASIVIQAMKLTLDSLKGEPVSHQFAKEALVGLVGAEIDRLAETKGMDFYDKERAKHQAKENVQGMYDNHYGGNDQYDP